MSGFRTQLAQRRQSRRDDGSALILVLVLIVVGSLVVLPLLDYAMSVTKANSVLSTKTRQQEAVKAGLRVALANPQELYRYCAGESEISDSQNVAMPQVNGFDLATSCEFLAFSAANDDSELHLGLAATKMGASVPPELRAVIETQGGLEVIDPVTGLPKRLEFEMDPTLPLDQWYVVPPTVPSDYTDQTRTLLSNPRRIWGPNLPERHTEVRSATAYNMPGSCGDDSCPPAPCKVYFPGTYADPLTLSGPVYFASGIYYFEKPVTVLGDAEVVVGMGSHLGCTTDQEAAFYALDVPSPHNISGLGGTFVLGSDARLVVTNDIGAPTLQFNQRYVSDTDYNTPASFGVSIVSVNGAVGGDGTIGDDGSYTLTDLSVPGVVQVPASQVGGVGLPTMVLEDGEVSPIPAAKPANDAGYKPSNLTHAPHPPTAAQNVVVKAFRTAASGGGFYVRWERPDKPGGLPVTYAVTVTNSGGTVLGSCAPSSTDMYECIVPGPIAVNNSSTNSLFNIVVRASNAVTPVGGEVAAAPVTAALRSTAPITPMLTAPATSTLPAPTVDAQWNGVVKLTWPAVTPAADSTRVNHYVVNTQMMPLATDPVGTLPTALPAAICAVDMPILVADPVDPERPDIIPATPTAPNPLYCHVRGLDPARQYQFNVVATNVNGLSTPVPATPTALGWSTTASPTTTLPTCDVNVAPAAAPATGCADWSAPVPVTYPYEPDPIIDIVLSQPDRADDKVNIDIPGLVAVPQGLFRLFNPHGVGKFAAPAASPPMVADGNTVQISGGILAAAFRVRDGRADTGDITVPIGLINPTVQRTYLMETCTPSCSSPMAKSTAVVQVNQNGAYAVNSWVVE